MEEEKEWKMSPRDHIFRDDDGGCRIATAEASAEEDETEVSTTIIEVSIEEVEDKMRPSERLQRRRRQCIYGIRVLTTTTVSLSE